MYYICLRRVDSRISFGNGFMHVYMFFENQILDSTREKCKLIIISI